MTIIANNQIIEFQSQTDPTDQPLTKPTQSLDTLAPNNSIKLMLNKGALNKVIEKYYLVKRPNKLQREAEQKIKSQVKSPESLQKHLNSSLKPKDFFAPMNDFISLAATHLNVSQLYKSKLLPAQFLSTSSKTIGRLTRQVYFSKKKANSFSVKALDEKCKPDKVRKRRKKTLSFVEPEYRKSLETLGKSCDQLARDNRRSLKYFERKNRILNRESNSTKNLLEKMKEVGKDHENKEFNENLKACHVLLTKLDRIHSKQR